MLTGAGGDETQDLIASEMAVSIVERFEMVDVDQEKGKRSVVRSRLRHGLSKELSNCLRFARPVSASVQLSLRAAFRLCRRVRISRACVSSISMVC